MGTSDRYTRLIFVRHGRAQAQDRSVVGGHKGCTGLTEQGRRQVERLRDRWMATGFRPDAMVTSILPRAIETAEILAAGLDVEVAAIPRECDLCERHPGEGDGLTWAAFVERYGALDPILQPDLEPSPGGETTNGFHARVLGAVERVAKEYQGQTVLVVCHGGVIIGATFQLLGIPFGRFSTEVPHTSITEWIHDGDNWMLARFNDTAHME